MRPTFHDLTIAAALLAGLAGCRTQTPVVYQRPIELDEWAAGLASPENTYQLLQTEKTEGRFACGVAVARLGRLPGAEDQRPKVVAMRPAEEVYWTELFRGVPEVREVVFLSPISVRRDGPTIDGLCAAAQRVGASLLLAHWPNRLGANSAEVIGVLYDIESRRPVATLHASNRFLNEDGVEESPADERGDQRHLDARYQAARSFEGFTRECLSELVRLDKPLTTPQRHPWETEWDQRWWVPKKIKIDKIE